LALQETSHHAGWNTINTYCLAVKAIWEDQVATHSNRLSWDLIFNKDCKLLAKMVKERKEHLKKKNYVEKSTKSLHPLRQPRNWAVLKVVYGTEDSVMLCVPHLLGCAIAIDFSNLSVVFYIASLFITPSCQICCVYLQRSPWNPIHSLLSSCFL
jgi:hypothetical protein